MRVYRLARELRLAAWPDAEILSRNRVMVRISAQLYTAIGSIAANLAEGYSRSSGRDRVRLYEYALGSARESTVWYESAIPVLRAEIVSDRLNKLEEIRRLLLAIIPRERTRLIRPTLEDPGRR
jgi:four helix bundle protein